MDMLVPIVSNAKSDSACLDNMIELLSMSGRSLPHVMMMLIPEAWDGNEDMDPVKKAFYEFHACTMEPWDGPASIAFTAFRGGRSEMPSFSRSRRKRPQISPTAGCLISLSMMTRATRAKPPISLREISTYA